ncbi:unnamed protein product [Blepharisma stoltei]|uniref:Ycf1 n=1 Tax=Blepharisma stoltei TaxID=1481888 RepID=A0AAU9JEU6_9CILI|nr:unnamed protein product [Blepharisma stoltei]
MEVPKILENLNDIHQNEEEESKYRVIGEELRSIYNQSSKPGFMRSVYRVVSQVPEHGQNCFISKLNNLLPKASLSKRLNLYSLLAKNQTTIKLSIPTTLLRLEGREKPYLLQTRRDGFLQVKPCHEDEFFVHKCKMNNDNFPLNCGKIQGRELLLFFTKEQSEKFWNSNKEERCLQNFILGKSNPASITRVLWREGMKNRYFTIINRRMINEKEKKSPNKKINAHKRNSSFTSMAEFKYTNLIFPTSKSINNPFKLSKRVERDKSHSFTLDIEKSSTLDSSFHTNVDGEKSSSDIDYTDHWISPQTISLLKDELNKEFIVSTKNTESCCAIETFIKIDDIEAMVDQIINFLNTLVFRQYNIKGIVLDFMQDKTNSWVLLNCKEYTSGSRINLEVNNLNLRRKSQKSNRSQSLEFSNIEEEAEKRKPAKGKFKAHYDDTQESKKNLPFKIKLKRPAMAEKTLMMSEKELLERCNKVNEKLDKILTQGQSEWLRTFNPKEESIKNYKPMYNFCKTPQMDPKIKSWNSIQSEYEKETQPKETFWDDKKHIFTRKCIMDAVDNIDEMAMNVQISRTKKQNLVKKYGGDDFWNQFIISLYSKILQNAALKARFKFTRVENFDMIVTGMFKIFDGDISLEFRRKVRSIHQNMSITTFEFNSYVNLFNATLLEFDIDSEDQRIIMAQINSMKGLVCR